MPKSLTKKLKNVLSIDQNHHETMPPKFIRSYSQLLKEHFTQSTKQKSSLRKNLSSMQDFRTKSKNELHQKKQDKVETHKNRQSKSNSKLSSNFALINLNESKNFSQTSHQTNELPMTQNYHQIQSKIQLNPETFEKIEQFLFSKTQMLEKNSHQNVILNQKLHRSFYQKRNLEKIVQELKMEILKEKKNKAKLSIEMGKLMNKIEHAKTGIQKTSEERFFIEEQTMQIDKQCKRENQKRAMLSSISEINRQKIIIQTQLINSLMSTIDSKKIQYSQLRTYFNELKEIFLREAKCLTKVEINYGLNLSERNFLSKTIEETVGKVFDSKNQTKLKKHYFSQEAKKMDLK